MTAHFVGGSITFATLSESGRIPLFREPFIIVDSKGVIKPDTYFNVFFW